MTSKRAVITGITGLDGSHFAKLLFAKGNEVHGLKRRSASFNTDRIEHVYQDPHEHRIGFWMHYGDLTDATDPIRVEQEVQADQIDDRSARSPKAVSLETAENTANSDVLGRLRLLQAAWLLDNLDAARCRARRASAAILPLALGPDRCVDQRA